MPAAGAVAAGLDGSETERLCERGNVHTLTWKYESVHTQTWKYESVHTLAWKYEIVHTHSVCTDMGERRPHPGFQCNSFLPLESAYSSMKKTACIICERSKCVNQDVNLRLGPKHKLCPTSAVEKHGLCLPPTVAFPACQERMKGDRRKMFSSAASF